MENITNHNEQISLDDIQSFAKILATIIWVDGDYSNEEKILIAKIAEELKIDSSFFCNLVGKQVSVVGNLSSIVISCYLKEASSAVSIANRKIIFEFGLQLVLLDNKLTYAEMSTVLALSSALELDEEYAMLLLVQRTSKNTNLKVELF